MPTLRLRFLGPLDIRYGGQQLPKPPTLKSQSLLAYLVLHRDQPQFRDRLATLFWGDRPERKARRSLTTGLWHIRRCLPNDGLILSDLHTVQFDPRAALWLDVDEFRSLASVDDIVSLQSAVELFEGDFLGGFYDDWIIDERYRLEALYLEALARLAAGHQREGNDEEALSAAVRLLDHDPLREDAHRAAMRAYCRLGRRNAALSQYERCREVMLEELGVEPVAETTELYQAILEGHWVSVGTPTVDVETPTASMGTRLTPVGRSPLDVVASSPLVGREQELASLHGFWQDMETTRGRLMFVSGEAGVGKSRLIEEFASRLRWQGVRVLWGRCYEFERVLPYQPVAEALRAALPTLKSSDLVGFPRWAITEVARLVPEMETSQDTHKTPPGRGLGATQGKASEVAHETPPERELRAAVCEAEGEAGGEVRAAPGLDQERARLFEGVTCLLARLAARGALLVVLEDLHWATESALQLVHYLVRRLADRQVLVVGTFRPEATGTDHPLLALRRQLTQQGLAETLRLSRLSPEAVEALVVEMSGAGEAAVPLAQRLYQETEGNPFFVMEIVRAFFEMGEIHLEAGIWQGNFARISEGSLPLPTGVSEVIQARVDRLGENTREAMRLAAVLGREFDFDPLNAAWGQGEEVTLKALDALLRLRLVEEGSGPMGRDYAFTHHKIQEVVYAGTPRQLRQHLHVRAGMAMERVYGPEMKGVAGELAFHFERGRQFDRTVTGKAIHYLLQAGDQARLAYAHQEAIDHYQKALELLKKQETYERAARTSMKLGLAYHNAFEFRRARQAFEDGFALWQRAGEVEPTGVVLSAPGTLRAFWLNLPTLDPTLTGHGAAPAVISQLFRGLVETGPELEVVPDLARHWEVLEGGRKYVFHLRDDARWSDGTPVTADDFEYAWRRALDPVTESPNASLLYDVAGARAFHQGEAGWEDVGVRAPDERTLVVELEGPTGYFLQLLAAHVTYALPQHAVEAQGESWTEVGNIVTNGPFRLEAWQPGQSMVLVRNPLYAGRFTGNVQRVELTLLRLKEWPDVLEMYEAGELDVLPRLWHIPPPERDRIRRRHAGEYVSVPALHTGYVGFDVSRPPFDDRRVRRAFGLAIDKETLVDVVNRGYWSPATGGFLPPGMPGHSPGIGLPYDPNGARQRLAEAGYPRGQGFPAIRAVTFQGIEASVEYLQAQWRKILGVEIACEAVRFDESEDELHTNMPDISISAWQASYPDPSDLLPPRMESACTGWQCEAFDQLVNEARRTMDQGERLKLYQQADRILAEQAPVIPWCHLRWSLLVKPWVKRYPASAIRQWFWKDVIVEPH